MSMLVLRPSICTPKGDRNVGMSTNHTFVKELEDFLQKLEGSPTEPASASPDLQPESEETNVFPDWFPTVGKEEIHAEVCAHTRSRAKRTDPVASDMRAQLEPDQLKHVLSRAFYIWRMRSPVTRKRAFVSLRNTVHKLSRERYIHQRWRMWRSLRPKVRVWLLSLSPLMQMCADKRKLRRAINKRRKARQKELLRVRDAKGAGNLRVARL